MYTNWSWIEMCGPGGLTVWYPTKHDIGTCFQQIFLLIPVLILFAIFSAYYYGSHSERTNFRRQKCIIHFRFTLTLLIAFVPVVRIIVGLQYPLKMFRPVDYLTAGVEIIAWFVHAGYVLSLRHRIKIHGPVIVRVLWTLVVSLAVINLRTQFLTEHSKDEVEHQLKVGLCLTLVVLQIFYGLTFFLFNKERSSSNSTLLRNHTQFTEESHLLSHVYHGFMEDLDPEYLGVAMEDESVTSKLIFHWVNPLIKKGCDKKLETCDDLYDLPHQLSSSFLCSKLYSALDSVKKHENYTAYGSVDVTIRPEPKKVTLLKALHKCFGFEFYIIGILKLFSDILGFGGPLLLNKLVDFIESKDAKTEIGYLCAFGLFTTTFLCALANVHFNFCMAKVNLKLRGSLIATIYRKTLNLHYLDVNKFSIGEIANFMSTDTDRVVNSCASFHSFWSIPLQIIVTFYLLYLQVGLAFLAGVFFTVILIPINKVIATKIGKISVNMMEQKDKRVASMAELLKGIRVLKIHVWEQYFLEKVLKIRAVEIKHLKARKYLDAVCVYFWATTPILISLLTFTTYSLMGNQLNAANIFTTLALLNMLIAPLNAFPWILNGLTEAWVSLLRIQKLLDCKDINFRDYYDTTSLTNKKAVFSLSNGFFQWDDNEIPINSNVEKDSNMPSCDEVEPMLLNDESAQMAGEIESQVQEKKNFILQNITMSINEGELVGVIGPVGSGKSTFLAALIGELKKIKGSIAMRNIEGGCALVTQSPWIQRGTFRENVLFGKSFDSNWYKKVIEGCCLTQDLETLAGDLVKIGEGGMTLSGGQRSRLALARAVYQNKDIYLLDDIFASVDVHVARHIYNKVVCGLLKNKTRVLCSNHIQFLTNADFIIRINDGRIVAKGKPSEILEEFEEFNNFDIDSESPKKDSKIKIENSKHVHETCEEISGIGSINLKVYKKYWTSIGHCLALIVLSAVILMQASRNLTDFWLSFWVSQEAKSNSTHYGWMNNMTKDYLKIYASLAVMNTFVTLIRSFLFAYSGIQAAIIIHRQLFKKILSSKITFFDISPIGRILNRFSSDTYTIDDSLPFILNILLAQFFGLLGSLVITTYGLPWLCLLLAPLVPLYHYLQFNYRNAARELKRLSSTSLSPIYSHFNDTLQGLTTIRSFRSLSQFRRINEELLECNQKAVFASQAANQWLSFRLQMMGVVLVSGVGVIAVLQHEFDVVDPAIVGLTVSYALSITSLLTGVISAFTETEKEMIAMERVTQYIEEIESELQGNNPPPYGWPSQGVISFQGVYLKYRDHIPPSLNGVSFETRPAEKIGIVGRTGAGKSSLINALIRLVNLSSGKILIDTVNINEISLQGLRSRISVIPQDPFLFEATIRTNLDPLGEYREEEIWSALQKCHMKDVIQSLGGLEAKVFAGGRNFSLGQRQLLCLVRAVLRNAKIVCVDEATAFVDTESDKKIQRTIRSSFRQSTVLTIAHRVSTVMDCDRILVLNDGEVVEFDSPKTLAFDRNSYFYQLCQQEPQYEI